jgi:DNA-binding NarL/FixJ family response regulator
MGGLEALPLLLAVSPRAQVIVMSGLDATEIEATARTQGAAGYVVKGSDPSRLVELARHLVAASSDGSGRRSGE